MNIMHKKLLLYLFLLNFSLIYSQEWKTIVKDDIGATYMKYKGINSVGNAEAYFKKYEREIKYFDEYGNVAIVKNGYSKELHEFNCTERKSRFLFMVIYDSNGNVIKNVNSISSWSYVVPDTYGEILLKRACYK